MEIVPAQPIIAKPTVIFEARLRSLVEDDLGCNDLKAVWRQDNPNSVSKNLTDTLYIRLTRFFLSLSRSQKLKTLFAALTLTYCLFLHVGLFASIVFLCWNQYLSRINRT